MTYREYLKNKKEKEEKKTESEQTPSSRYSNLFASREQSKKQEQSINNERERLAFVATRKAARAKWNAEIAEQEKANDAYDRAITMLRDNEDYNNSLEGRAGIGANEHSWKSTMQSIYADKGLRDNEGRIDAALGTGATDTLRKAVNSAAAGAQWNAYDQKRKNRLITEINGATREERGQQAESLRKELDDINNYIDEKNREYERTDQRVEDTPDKIRADNKPFAPGGQLAQKNPLKSAGDDPYLDSGRTYKERKEEIESILNAYGVYNRASDQIINATNTIANDAKRTGWINLDGQNVRITPEEVDSYFEITPEDVSKYYNDVPYVRWLVATGEVEAPEGLERDWADEAALVNSEKFAYEYLDEDEKRALNFDLHANGPVSSNRALKDMQADLNRRATEYKAEYFRKGSIDLLSSKEADALQRIMNLAAGPAGVAVQATMDQFTPEQRATAVTDTVAPLVTGAAKLVTTPVSFLDALNQSIPDEEGIVRRNPYSPYQAQRRFAEKTTQRTVQDIDNLTGGKDFLGMTLGDVYQAAMSSAESLAGSYIFGPGYSVIMGMGAATDEMNRLAEQGANNGESVVGGLLAGAAETVFEHVSLEHFANSFINGIPETIREAVKDILVQAGVEGSEEFFTEIANTLTNSAVMGSQSEWDRDARKYMDSGMSKEEAYRQVWTDKALDLWKATASGALSGAMMGGGGTLANYADMNANLVSTGENLIDNDSANLMRDLAEDLASERLGLDEKSQKRVERAAKAYDKKQTAKSLGTLANAVETAIKGQREADIEDAVANLSKEDAERATSIFNTLITYPDFELNDDDLAFIQRDDVQDAYAKVFGDKASKVYSDTGTYVDEDGRYNIERSNPGMEREARYDYAVSEKGTKSENIPGVGKKGAEVITRAKSGGADLAPVVAAYNQGVKGEEFTAGEADTIQKEAYNAGKLDAIHIQANIEKYGKAVVNDNPGLDRASVKSAGVKYTSSELRQLDAVGRVVGSKVQIVKNLTDDEGNPVNALYDNKTSTILISTESETPVRAALAHEVVHRIRAVSEEAYQSLQRFVISNMSKDKLGSALYARSLAYGTTETGYLTEEAVGDAFADIMEANPEAINQLVKQDRKLGEKIRDIIRDILIKIDRFLARRRNLSKMTKEERARYEEDRKAMEAEFSELRAKLVQAESRFSSALNEVAYTLDMQAKTDNAGMGVDPETETLFSVRYEPGMRGVRSREQIAKMLADQLVKDGFSKEEATKQADKFLEDVNGVANQILGAPEYLDFTPDDRYKAIKLNSDYPQGTIDLSNNCPKREGTTVMFDMLQRLNPDRLFTADDIVEMKKILESHDMVTACDACFVEDRRQKLGEIADTFIGMWKDARETGNPLQKTNAKGAKVTMKVTKKIASQYGVKQGALYDTTDDYIPNQYDLVTYEGFRALQGNHKWIAAAFEAYNNSRGQQAGRFIEGHAEYKREILDWNDKKVKKVNDAGGLRIFSFSDFQPVHMLDIIQVITDCAAKGVKIQGYTKNPLFARIIRNTGVKLNRSLIPLGKTGMKKVNGKNVLAYDTKGGIDINSKDFLDERDNPNVGNILIGINAEQIALAFEDDFVDYIIPFHSNKAKAILQSLGIGEWNNYKLTQTEKNLAGETVKNVNIYTQVIDKYNPQNKVEFVNSFLDECCRQKKVPRYAEFLNKEYTPNGVYTDEGGKFNYTYREGYHKLLIDFKMFDRQGNILLQGNVRPDFVTDQMTRVLNEEIKARKNYKFPQEVFDEVQAHFDQKKYSRKISPEDSARYLDLAKNPVKNEAELSRMVEAAARGDGYDSPLLYHGTSRFGFTRVNGYLFATDSEETAGTYSETKTARNISKDTGTSFGMYRLYANTDGMLVFDANGAETNHIALGDIESRFNWHQMTKTWHTHATINQIIKYAKENGYTGVIVKNVVDSATPQSRKTTAPATDYVFFDPQSQIKSADPVTYDDQGNVIPLEERFNPRNEDIRYSLKPVRPILPTKNGWTRGATFDEVKAEFPTLFELDADEAETRNPTQIKGTVSTYRKIYDKLRSEGFNGTILDASSGLGYGTQVGRDEYGFDVDDIEPFPDKSYTPRYTDYSTLDKKYDAIISNAVLNVIPQDLRDAMVVKIGEMLKPGGRAFINVRGDDVRNASSKEAINEDQMEYFISNTGSYQKGFTPSELKAYLEDALGDRFKVSLSREFGRVSAIVEKDKAQFSRGISNYKDLVAQYGRIPEGERPFRDIEVPARTARDKKVSRAVRSALEAKVTPDEMVPTIQQLIADGVYSFDVYTDEQAIANAKAEIEKDGFTDALTRWVKDVENGRVNKTITATGWALYDAAATAGDTEAALTVLRNIVGNTRSAAQALQATRILKKMSPEAQLYNVVKTVDQIVRDAKERYGTDLDIQVDPDLAEDYLNARSDEERSNILNKIYKEIARQLPTRWIDRWNAWRYLSMLGNPRTHIRNIVGNAGFMPVVLTKDALATGIESAVNFVSGGRLDRTKGNLIGRQGASLLKAAAADYANVREEALGERKYSDLEMPMKEIADNRRIFGNTKSKTWNKTGGRALEAVRKANSKALDVEDVWFSKPHYALAMAQYCKAHGITAEQIESGKGLDKARQYAIKEAQKATYRDTNAFSAMVSKIGRRSPNDNAFQKVGKGLVEGILPFRKTPANILARGVEYSPIGLLKSLTTDLLAVRLNAEYAQAAAKGEKPSARTQKLAKIITPMTGAEMIDHLSAGLTGTGLMALGALLASLGIVKGHGGDDDKDDAFNSLRGHQKYSIEIGDVSITLDWLAPESLPFFVGVNLAEETQEEGDGTFEDLLTAIGNTSEPFIEMSCLQSLNDLLDSIGYAKSKGMAALPNILVSMATSYVTQGLPTIAGQGERLFESERQTTFTDRKGVAKDLQYQLGKAANKIPIYDYNQIPYIDAWGREEQTGNFIYKAFSNFVNPAYVKKISFDEVEDEIERLYASTGEAGVLPSRAEQSFKVNGEEYNLTANEYVKYATAKGKTSYEVVGMLTKNAAYKDLNDGDKAAVIDLAYAYATGTARTTVGAPYSDASSSTWIPKAAEANRRGITPDVYIIAKEKISNIGSIKDKDGKAIDNSAGLLKMQYIYSIPGLTGVQRKYLFEQFNIGKKIIGLSQREVDAELAKIRK